MKLPPDLASAVGLATWPEHASARAALTRGLPTADRVALLTWVLATGAATEAHSRDVVRERDRATKTEETT